MWGWVVFRWVGLGWFCLVSCPVVSCAGFVLSLVSSRLVLLALHYQPGQGACWVRSAKTVATELPRKVPSAVLQTAPLVLSTFTEKGRCNAGTRETAATLEPEVRQPQEAVGVLLFSSDNCTRPQGVTSHTFKNM